MAHGYSDYDPNKQDTSYILFENCEKGQRITEKIIVKEFVLEIQQYHEAIMGMLPLSVAIHTERGW